MMMASFISITLSQQAAADGGASLLAYGLGLLAIVVGITLWLMGRRLARPTCAALWVVLGIIATGGICSMLGDGGLLPLWLIAGGIVAGALGWLMYRLCLALALALVLAAVAPATLHLLQLGQQQPEAAQSIIEETDTASSAAQLKTNIQEAADRLAQDVKDTGKQAGEKVRQAVKQVVNDAADAVLGNPDTDEKPDEAMPATAVSQDAGQNAGQGWQAEAKQAASQVKEQVRDFFGDQDRNADSDSHADAREKNSFVDVLAVLFKGPWEKLAASWEALPGSARVTLMLACAIGAAAGFLIGLLVPKTAAWAGSSLLGTLFMAGGASLMLSQYNPDLLERLSQRLSQCLLAMGLITLLGMLIQWILSRRQADN